MVWTAFRTVLLPLSVPELYAVGKPALWAEE